MIGDKFVACLDDLEAAIDEKAAAFDRYVAGLPWLGFMARLRMLANSLRTGLSRRLSGREASE